MAAYMKMANIKGEAEEKAHADWIKLQSMGSAVHRSIPQGAVAMQRARGETTLADLVVVRDLDSSSVKLVEACANGTYFKEVQIDFCTQVGDKQEVYLTYKLADVIVSSYSLHANASGQPLPTEEVTLSFSKVDWNYVPFSREGKKGGNIPGSYDPGKGATK